jgi:hypothetical protein
MATRIIPRLLDLKDLQGLREKPECLAIRVKQDRRESKGRPGHRENKAPKGFEDYRVLQEVTLQSQQERS